MNVLLHAATETIYTEVSVQSIHLKLELISTRTISTPIHDFIIYVYKTFLMSSWHSLIAHTVKLAIAVDIRNGYQFI